MSQEQLLDFDKPPSPIVVKPGDGGPVRNPGPTDVLCGRGGSINSHEGNTRFRDIVFLHKPLYLAKTTKKVEKANIAALVVKKIRESNPPGRFLKRENNEAPWEEIGDEKARKKAGQALRENAPEIRNTKGIADSTTSAANLPAATTHPTLPHNVPPYPYQGPPPPYGPGPAGRMMGYPPNVPPPHGSYYQYPPHAPHPQHPPYTQNPPTSVQPIFQNYSALNVPKLPPTRELTNPPSSNINKTPQGNMMSQTKVPGGKLNPIRGATGFGAYAQSNRSMAAETDQMSKMSSQVSLTSLDSMTMQALMTDPSGIPLQEQQAENPPKIPTTGGKETKSTWVQPNQLSQRQFNNFRTRNDDDDSSMEDVDEDTSRDMSEVHELKPSLRSRFIAQSNSDLAKDSDRTLVMKGGGRGFTSSRSNGMWGQSSSNFLASESATTHAQGSNPFSQSLGPPIGSPSQQAAEKSSLPLRGRAYMASLKRHKDAKKERIQCQISDSSLEDSLNHPRQISIRKKGPLLPSPNNAMQQQQQQQQQQRSNDPMFMGTSQNSFVINDEELMTLGEDSISNLLRNKDDSSLSTALASDTSSFFPKGSSSHSGPPRYPKKMSSVDSIKSSQYTAESGDSWMKAFNSIRSLSNKNESMRYVSDDLYSLF